MEVWDRVDHMLREKSKVVCDGSVGHTWSYAEGKKSKVVCDGSVGHTWSYAEGKKARLSAMEVWDTLDHMLREKKQGCLRWKCGTHLIICWGKKSKVVCDGSVGHTWSYAEGKRARLSAMEVWDTLDHTLREKKQGCLGRKSGTYLMTYWKQKKGPLCWKHLIHLIAQHYAAHGANANHLTTTSNLQCYFKYGCGTKQTCSWKTQDTWSKLDGGRDAPALSPSHK